ncbi:methylmalonyl-CoA mutase [Algoriphagus iocasae]|uniref:Methylmalonyl-CoA mutase n=1 Tax=Algoriphagus iocasae TaxID=1836499 RepID=A0A841M9N2_9BACT|nr:methylmalonyl-CoA mutase family protein [Algoriphagus iocasae]MBB6324632.1 methylmalonyl-CoA mutase [Algoriphagus iocasae]
MTKDNFYDFPKVSKSEWEKLVRMDLKGKDYSQTLVNKVWGELNTMPFYTLEDLPGEISQESFHEKAKLPGFSPRIWNNAVSIFPQDEKKGNQEILLALENGADALVLHLTGLENLNELLKGVMTEFIQIYFKPLDSPRILYNQIIDWIEKLHIKPSMLSGAVLWSPCVEMFHSDADFEENVQVGAEMIDRFSEFREFFPMTLDSSIYANSGANGIQQCFLGVGEMIELMDSFIKKAVSPAMILENFAFHLAVGELFFPEIVKLKAFRRLLVELAANMGQQIDGESLHFIISTSIWSKSLLDKNSNLIRQTYEAMAAVMGGANSLWVRPVQEGKATKLEKRIARNVSTILKEESYLDKVMDPASGSYFLENLENDLVKMVLEKLEKLEDDGGWLKNFQSRSIHNLVKHEREKVQNKLLSAESVKVGANKYVLKGSSESDAQFEEIEEKEFELKLTRATYLLEKENLKNS